MHSWNGRSGPSGAEISMSTGVTHDSLALGRFWPPTYEVVSCCTKSLISGLTSAFYAVVSLHITRTMAEARRLDQDPSTIPAPVSQPIALTVRPESISHRPRSFTDQIRRFSTYLPTSQSKQMNDCAQEYYRIECFLDDVTDTT